MKKTKRGGYSSGILEQYTPISHTNHHSTNQHHTYNVRPTSGPTKYDVSYKPDCKECDDHTKALLSYLLSDELLKFYLKTTKIIDKVDLRLLKVQPNDICKILDKDDFSYFVQWCYEKKYIDKNKYQELNTKIDRNTYNLVQIDDYINPIYISKFINEQTDLAVRFPSMKELGENGLNDQLIKLIQDDLANIVPKDYIYQTTTEYLNDLYSVKQFLTVKELTLIYKNPKAILRVLTVEECVNLLKRTSSYLDYVTPEKIDSVQELTEGSLEVGQIFTDLEIKGMLDKEVDLKNAVLNALTKEEVDEMFANFKTELFQNDFHTIINEAMNNFELYEPTIHEWIKTSVQNFKSN